MLKGFNIAWPHPNPGLANVTGYYRRYFARMQAVGANYARVWLAPNLAKPWNPLALLSSYDRVDPAVAAVVDDLLALAQTYGVRLMLVLESFNALCPAAVASRAFLKVLSARALPRPCPQACCWRSPWIRSPCTSRSCARSPGGGQAPFAFLSVSL